MVTWSLLVPQGPLLMDHWNTLVPTERPVTPLFDAFGELMVPEPLTKVQLPVALPTGALPASVALEVVLHWD
jgi:hypothetical protein